MNLFLAFGFSSSSISPRASSTPSASPCLKSRVASIRCSIVSSAIKLITFTLFFWCFLHALAIRCSNFAGFHGKSMLITTLAACRFKPTPPESVERKTLYSGLFLKLFISSLLFSCGTEPTFQLNFKLFFSSWTLTSSSIFTHSENMMIFLSGLFSHISFNTLIASSTLGESVKFWSRI